MILLKKIAVCSFATFFLTFSVAVAELENAGSAMQHEKMDQSEAKKPGMGMMGGHCVMMRRTEGALAFLKTELHITTNQESAFETFAKAFRDHANHQRQEAQNHKPKQGMHHKAHASFDAKMSQHLEMMEHHQSEMKKMFTAANTLYDALDPGQRIEADTLLMHFTMSHCGMTH